MKRCNMCDGNIKDDSGHSILMYDTNINNYTGRLFCPKCSKKIYKIILANNMNLFNGIVNKVKDIKEDIELFKNNIIKKNS